MSLPVRLMMFSVPKTSVVPFRHLITTAFSKTSKSFEKTHTHTHYWYFML